MFEHYLQHIASELRGSWLGQPLIFQAMEHVLRLTWQYLGFTSQVRQHCTFTTALPPHHVKHSGFYPAGRLVCTFKQYVTKS